MITLRPSKSRGHFDHGWLDTYHTFSFGDYQDPAHMSFRSLRVINDDIVAPGAGFPRHPHRDMEILTFVLQGALEHQDSSGGGGVIRPGDVQRMSAGKGIYHSEFNHSKTDPVRLLQVWILPDRAGHTPRYDQKHFPAAERTNKLSLAASPDGAAGSLSLNQDARVYTTILEKGQSVSLPLAQGRHAWVQVGTGKARLNGTHDLAQGDGAALTGEKELKLTATEPTEALVFDLA